jgi:hypothetical protein
VVALQGGIDLHRVETRQVANDPSRIPGQRVREGLLRPVADHDVPPDGLRLERAVRRRACSACGYGKSGREESPAKQDGQGQENACVGRHKVGVGL